MDDEDGDGLAKFGACFHYTEAEGDDLRGQQEIDDFGRVVLHESADNAEGGQAEVLEGARLGSGVEEGVEVERDVCLRKRQLEDRALGCRVILTV